MKESTPAVIAIVFLIILFVFHYAYAEKEPVHGLLPEANQTFIPD